MLCVAGGGEGGGGREEGRTHGNYPLHSRATLSCTECRCLLGRFREGLRMTSAQSSVAFGKASYYLCKKVPHAVLTLIFPGLGIYESNRKWTFCDPNEFSQAVHLWADSPKKIRTVTF